MVLLAVLEGVVFSGRRCYYPYWRVLFPVVDCVVSRTLGCCQYYRVHVASSTGGFC